MVLQIFREAYSGKFNWARLISVYSLIHLLVCLCIPFLHYSSSLPLDHLLIIIYRRLYFVEVWQFYAGLSLIIYPLLNHQNLLLNSRLLIWLNQAHQTWGIHIHLVNFYAALPINILIKCSVLHPPIKRPFFFFKKKKSSDSDTRAVIFISGNHENLMLYFVYCCGGLCFLNSNRDMLSLLQVMSSKGETDGELKRG